MTDSVVRNILITGTRGWDDFAAFEKAVNAYYNGPDAIRYVHGGCPSGADKLASMRSRIPGDSEAVYLADWDTHGKAAGFIRNTQMAKLSPEVCLAFWDGKSNGTRHMIEEAVKHGIPVRIFPIKVEKK